jgi:diguanylate cyclase (GGDEF)-like protein
MTQGGSVLPSALSHIAGDRKRSRWEKARLSLLLPIGIVVAIAIICVVVAVLTSAQRANEVSLAREQELIQDAVIGHGVRFLQQLKSIASTSRAVLFIRDNYDVEAIDRRAQWLLDYYDHDVAVVLDGEDQIKYRLFRDSADASADIRSDLTPTLALLRGRLSALPDNVIPIVPNQNLANPGRSTALIQRFLDRPAIVSAAAVGSDSQLATGNDHAPIEFSVKYIDAAMLHQIASRRQLTGLRLLDKQAPTADEHTIVLSDAHGGVVAQLTWKPTRPGAQIAGSILPFIVIALAGFGVLIGLMLRYMRRTAEEIRAGESQLRHLALHDPVCGLPNRIYFGDRLEKIINDVRQGGETAAVFYIDLDHFKDVNDTLGHHIGDELILAVTQRLSRIMRGDDLVARLGGDEFAIITTCTSDSYSLQAIAGRIITAVCAPYQISGHNIIIGASVGIAAIERRARDAADILRYADMALYRAKNEGRNRACIYDAAMDADLSNRKLLEGDLLFAIKNDGLAAAYQPLMNASGDTIIGVEALARWAHPTLGQIPPSQFIPIAEHSGLIVELGEWMLKRACLDGRAWPGLTVAVNVSPLQFRRSDFVEVVERILTETDFPANRLELELTESTLLGNLETAELSMLRLKAIGVRFALDDFGTGYSSLLYLRRFPFDKLKIDSSFVRSIEKAPDAAAIVHAVVSLGRGLGMRVTAEGVETAEQHLFLRAAGVHQMQGYRFGKPGPASEINARLASPDDYRVSSPDLEVALAS